MSLARRERLPQPPSPLVYGPQPGLDTDFDADEALSIGDRWLQESRYPGRRIIALNAAKMINHRRYLADLATRYEVVAPPTRNHPRRGGHAVLAVWAWDRALELAESLANPGGGVCLIPGKKRFRDYRGRTI